MLSLLIITSSDDVHADYIVEKLRHRNVDVCRFHPDKLLFESRLNFASELLPQWSLGVPPVRNLNLAELEAIYYRKPKPVQARSDTAPDVREFCSWEGRYCVDSFLNYLHTKPSVRWINDDRQIRVAEDKPAQLIKAKEFGLMIPDTLVTTDPDLAFAFYKANCVHGVIVKSFISRGLPPRTGAYTHKLACDLTSSDFDSVAASPTLLQVFVKKKFDIRAVVIRDRVFAFRIDSQLVPGAVVDFRAVDMRSLRHSLIELPGEIALKLRDMACAFGLVHAECDLCIDSSENYVFLEMNPNGQWLWLELQTGVPIADAFVDELLQRPGAD